MESRNEKMKRIAKNTLLLYGRMFFGMIVSLYTSRVVLKTLGVEDFGIYNVVGGLVALFSLLSGSLSAAVSRFLTFELGKGDDRRLASVFSTSLIVHIMLAFVVLICAETVGVWFLNYKMVIPEERLYAASWLLQFSLFSFLIGLISIPYNASIVSHEHFKVFAYIGVTDTVVKLLIVFLLVFLPCSVDKLIVYSLLIFCSGLFFQLYYWWYCRVHFKECRFSLSFEKADLKKITHFAGWNFIGASSAVLRDQGGNILLNLLAGGPLVNAARAVASSVSAAVGAFVNNFMIAVNPQITKAYAANDISYMMSLIYRSARFSYYLLLLLCLPILLNTYYILDLWLDLVPEYAVNFTRLVLIFIMCESISNPLVTAMLATGNIRNYQLVVGGLQMLNLPLSYIILRLYSCPESVLIIAVFISLCCLFARLYMLRGMISLSARKFIREVIFNILLVTLFAIVVPLLCSHLTMDELVKFLVSCLLCLIFTGASIYWIGCNKYERSFLLEKISVFLHINYKKSNY